jgi:hypothetical protein
MYLSRDDVNFIITKDIEIFIQKRYIIISISTFQNQKHNRLEGHILCMIF